MAFAFARNLDTSNEETSDTSLVHTVLNGASVGELVVVACITDNAVTGSSSAQTNEHSSVTDSKGNTYTKLAEASGDDGSAAGAGCTISLWYSIIATALVASTDTITLTVANAVTAKALRGYAYTLATSAISVDDVAFSVATSNSIVTSSGTVSSVERLWLGLTGIERGGSTTVTADTDYSGRGPLESATSSTAGVSALMGDRIATLTSDTYTGSTSQSGDLAQILVALSEDAGGGGASEDTSRGVLRGVGRGILRGAA